MRFDAVLGELWRRIAHTLDVFTTEDEAAAFGSEANIASWPAFDGTLDALRALQSDDAPGYRLVALSNVDRFATDMTFAATGLDGVAWAKVFTAEDFGTAAEDLRLADQRKFEALLRFAGETGVEKGEILHVAQSLGHDHKPAKDVGVASVFLVGDGPVWGKEGESRMAVENGLVGYGWRCKDLREFAGIVEREVKS